MSYYIESCLFPSVVAVNINLRNEPISRGIRFSGIQLEYGSIIFYALVTEDLNVAIIEKTSSAGFS